MVWREWKPSYVLPSPADVGAVLRNDLFTAELWRAVGHTMRQAVIGFGFSLVIGGAVGIAVTRSRSMRLAVGSMITGLQTMPSIAWFPFAILLFEISDAAILLVVVPGAAPKSAAWFSAAWNARSWPIAASAETTSRPHTGTWVS